MATKRYRDYFSIDPEYFPQATEELIYQGKIDWKKFYPHETFVKLIKDAINVLTRQQKLCLWVEGAYGTGKSHAVLTLKKLLEASEEETRAYFDNYGFLSLDLFNKLQGVKGQGKILAVHRYGSATINSDRDLIIAVQESIKAALKDNGLDNKGEIALRDSAINWLSDEANKSYFNQLVLRQKELFGGDDVDAIIEKLQTYSEANLISLMRKIFAIADEAGISAIRLDIDGLIAWIKSVIEGNNLKAIMFIWDEFTEYFQNNRRHLTGFQKLIEMSATNPFYLCIVTHKSAALFDDTDDDKKKILGRFVSPTCNIELPENMAFRLMGQAMEKKNDDLIRKDWDDAAAYLNDSLSESRKQVVEAAKISDTELMAVLPIQPYTALLLKHISSAFDSNQRSMFDFIKNDRGDEVKAFQWFIDNYGPDDDDPLLTIDMLWDFFYEKGKDNLAPGIRTILDCYHRQNTALLSADEQRVLKTVLLLQAISQKVGGSVDLFIPNEKNLNYAFEGSQLANGRAASIAGKLVRDQILYLKPLGQNKNQYSAMINAGDGVAVDKIKDELRKNKKTKDLVNEGEVQSVLGLPSALALRYEIEFATVDNFKLKINELRNKENVLGNRTVALIAFAKNDEESASLSKSINEASKDSSYHMIFIDASITPFGADAFEQYLDNMANSSYQRGKDNALANQYEGMAREVLKKWKERIAAGEFAVYSSETDACKRFSNIDELIAQLGTINRAKYPLGLEQYKVIDNMYSATSMKQGAECGAREETAGTFRSANPSTKLENALACAWKIDKYWQQADKRNEPIVKTKLAVEQLIRDGFGSDEGRISIAAIYEELKKEPYGYLPCNLTAFVLGFLLKEYANDTYRWTNDETSEPMNTTKLKEMIDEIIKLQLVPNQRYKDKYIVAMTAEERKFSEVTSEVFSIPENQCASIQQIRDRIRVEMKKLSFPIWCLKYIIGETNITSDDGVICELIDLYCGIANTNNYVGKQSEADIALRIGKLCIDNDEAKHDLLTLINKENCIAGMKAFIRQYKDGALLALVNSIGAETEYLDTVRSKFDAEASNWVWSIETAEQRIDEVIIEYAIISESNKINSKTNRFDAMIQAWCNKLNMLKVSFEVVKPYVDDIGPLLEILVAIKKTGHLSDSSKLSFLEMLTLKQQTLKDFFIDQKSLFKSSCSFYVEDLTDDEIAEVMRQIPSGVFTKEKSEYFTMIDVAIEEFKKNQGKRILKQLWKDKTNSMSPRDWSTIHKTPILCMIPENEIATARATFGTINRNNPDSADINRAMEYIEKAAFFDSLNDGEERNRRFVEHVVKNYAVILPDADEVRSYLLSKVSADPYDWYANGEVESRIRQLAEARYNTGGSAKALEVIDEMDEAKVKDYLKRLIRDNINVGIEIIKDK